MCRKEYKYGILSGGSVSAMHTLCEQDVDLVIIIHVFLTSRWDFCNLFCLSAPSLKAVQKPSKSKLRVGPLNELDHQDIISLWTLYFTSPLYTTTSYKLLAFPIKPLMLWTVYFPKNFIHGYSNDLCGQGRAWDLDVLPTKFQSNYFFKIFIMYLD